jgi:hypothetical protein
VASEGPTNQRSTVNRSRTVNLGTGPRALPTNARTSSSVNQDGENSRSTRHRGNGDGTGGENAADNNNDASTINSSSSSLARAAAAFAARPMEQG